jgi:hypothetical protein
MRPIFACALVGILCASAWASNPSPPPPPGDPPDPVITGDAIATAGSTIVSGGTYYVGFALQHTALASCWLQSPVFTAPPAVDIAETALATVMCTYCGGTYRDRQEREQSVYETFRAELNADGGTSATLSTTHPAGQESTVITCDAHATAKIRGETVVDKVPQPGSGVFMATWTFTGEEDPNNPPPEEESVNLSGLTSSEEYSG